MKKKTIIKMLLAITGAAVGYYLVAKKWSNEWEKYFSEEDEYDEDFDLEIYEDLDEEYDEKCKHAGCNNGRETINVTELMEENNK